MATRERLILGAGGGGGCGWGGCFRQQFEQNGTLSRARVPHGLRATTANWRVLIADRKRCTAFFCPSRLNKSGSSLRFRPIPSRHIEPYRPDPGLLFLEAVT